MARIHDASEPEPVVLVTRRRLRELERDSKILDAIERQHRRLSPAGPTFRERFRELARLARRLNQALADATDRAEAEKTARRVRIDSAAEIPPPSPPARRPGREAGSPERESPAGR